MLPGPTQAMHANALLRRVARHAAETPFRVAVCAWDSRGPVETTYAELYGRAVQLASFLARHSAPGSIVPLLVAKSADSIAAMMAAMLSGRTFCFVNLKYRGPQIAAILKASRASLCLIDPAGLVALRGSASAVLEEACPAWGLLGQREVGPLHAQTLAELQARAPVHVVPDPGVDIPPVRCDAHEEIGACLFTSGSSGEPKGVLVATDDLVQRAAAEAEWFDLSERDVLLSVLPFSFDVGLNQLLSSLFIGAELVLLNTWLVADMLAATAARRVSGISGVPAIWQDLLRSGLRFDRSGPHRALRYVTVSGGSLPAPLLRQLRERVDGAAIFKTYGQTEAFRTTSLRPDEFDRKPDSVGRAFSGVRVYVVREDGSPCTPGEIGEVVHTGLGIMKGYLGNRELSDAERRKLRPNPFFGPTDQSPYAIFTGDMGYLDEEGFLYLKGRRDDMVKIQGNRVYPQEVTAQILCVPGVRDSVVVSHTEDDGTISLTAFVVPIPEAKLTVGQLRRELNRRLPSYMVPNNVVFVHAIPRTATGKADVRRLSEARTAGEA